VDSIADMPTGARLLILAPDADAARPLAGFLIPDGLADRAAATKASAERAVAEAQRELATLRATATVKPGLIARLLGRGGPSELVRQRVAEWEARQAAAENELRLLAANPVPPRSVALVFPGEAPPRDGPYDRLLVMAAERILSDEFHLLAVDHPRAILLGDAAPPASPYRNGVPQPFRSPFFGELWRSTGGPLWDEDDGRRLCRLIELDEGQRGALSREPLADCPEIELRFLNRGADPVLAEIAFAERFTLADAATWLAENLGDQEPVTRARAIAEPAPPIEQAAGELVGV
jgi:hypothetical protein